MTSPVGGTRPVCGHHGKHATEPHVHQGQDGRIVLHGTGESDQFNVRSLQNGYYGVNVAYGAQGQARDFTFTKDQMSRLTINARGGNDTIAVAQNVDVPIRVRGGAGNDQLLNAANGTQLYGGQGDDFISNTGAGVTINGGRGADRIQSVGHNNTIHGGRGADTIGVRGSGNFVDAGRGNDNVQVFGNTNTVRGRQGNDTLFAGGVGNVLQGNRGWDQLGAIGYGNVLQGGLGRDNLQAIGGANQLNGGGQRGDVAQTFDIRQLFQLLMPQLPWNQGYAIDPRGWGC